MKIRYEFVTGEASEVAVTEELGAAIEAFERQAELKDRAETRRHTSLDQLLGAGAQFGDDVDMEYAVITVCEVSRAIMQLQPQQRALIQKVFFEERSYASIAHEEGVDESAIRRRLERAIVNLCKVLK